MLVCGCSGMTALVNDNLISNVFSVGIIVIALLFGLVGALLAYLLPLSITNSVGLDAVLLGILGGYLGVAVGVTISSVIDSAVAMLYVCFTNSPEFLKVCSNTLCSSASIYYICSSPNMFPIFEYKLY